MSSLISGDGCFHAEELKFRGELERTDTSGNATDFRNRRKFLCAVNNKGNYFEIEHPESEIPYDSYPTACYQIVVTHNIEEDDCYHLAAIRSIKITGKDKRSPAAVSYSQVLRYMNGAESNKLLTMRPDRMSPDGVNIVDYSFEYDIFWVDRHGRSRTNVNTDDESASEIVRDSVKMLRERHWDKVHASVESVIGRN